MKRVIIFHIAIGCAFFIHAQKHNSSLQIGKPFTDTTRLEIFYANAGKASIQDLRGVPLVVELFSSNCLACFKGMPKLDSLKREFDGKVRFLLVGFEDGKIRTTYERFKKKFDLSLPVAYDSSFIKKMGVKGYPFYIWINEGGVVTGITLANAVTKENLANFATIGKLKENQSVKRLHFDAQKPFLINGNGGADSNYLYRSVLTKWDASKPVYMPPIIDFERKQNFIQILGVSLPHLYNYAFFGETQWNDKHPRYGSYFPYPVIDDDDLPMYPDNRMAYCYSLWTSSDRPVFTSMKELFQQDLENQFGYKAKIEKRTMPYYRLVLKDGYLDSLRSKSSQKSGEVTHAGFSFRRQPMKLVISTLARYFPNMPPFIDETEINFPIDIEVNAIMSDFDEVRQEFYRKGLVLEKGQREMTVIVLRSKSGNVAAN